MNGPAPELALERLPGTVEVLAADDDPISLAFLQARLDSLGCRVRTVASGDEVLSEFERTADQTQLVVLDARMPGPPPVELHDRIHAINPAVPILFYSGLSPEVPELLAINEAGLWLLSKPACRQSLLNALKQMLFDAVELC